MTTLKALGELTAEYQNLMRKWHELAEYQNTIKEPLKPPKIESEIELQKYLEDLRKYQYDRNTTSAELVELTTNCKEAKRKIINSIPLSNTWFKVVVNGEAFGVGCYTDAWGGNHTEIAIVKWKEDMPSLKNKLDYN